MLNVIYIYVLYSYFSLLGHSASSTQIANNLFNLARLSYNNITWIYIQIRTKINKSRIPF